MGKLSRQRIKFQADRPPEKTLKAVTGEFLLIEGERYYAIRNVDLMPPCFISIVSDSDHWLYISSAGGLTAGRVSPNTALFPYISVDKIHECDAHTGSVTLLRCMVDGEACLWEPFSHGCDSRWSTEHHVYKNFLGNKICIESINHDLRLTFRYTWMNSDEYGFVRQAELLNWGEGSTDVDIIDGLRNILPANAPLMLQAGASYLIDAYKWNELDQSTGLALYTLYSTITDRTEPSESLRANTVFSLGMEGARVLLSAEAVRAFSCGREFPASPLERGVRGAYLLSNSLHIAGGDCCRWKIVADIHRDQAHVSELRLQLSDRATLEQAVERSIVEGSDRLARRIASADGFQATAEDNVTLHHYTNVLFNLLRGGMFDDQYRIARHEFIKNINHFNRNVAQRHHDLLAQLPEKIDVWSLRTLVAEKGDRQLERLAGEYLPITFGRRHGDPSRPWNKFEIKLRDEKGARLLAYQGNWRDIFQNWEALLWSYPGFIENVIGKFVNASTMDGYNPYRITHEGIDWEEEDPDDPWSYIGYWGDHQIIYLLKLLEMSMAFHPGCLQQLLHTPIFSYVNVPYRIKPFDDIRRDPKNTVVYDEEVAARIARCVEQNGADGKQILDEQGEVYQVNLLEKLLVPMLAKLGNLVADGGIWLNTQRPEWNDANNALVGHGLSMVTLYYLRRYIAFLQKLLVDPDESFKVTLEVSLWLTEMAVAINRPGPLPANTPLEAHQRYTLLTELGQVTSRYRAAIYRNGGHSGTVTHPISQVTALLADTLRLLDHTIGLNRRDDGLYHAYNLLRLRDEKVELGRLYLMLEGQVAVLSSGAIPPEEAVSVIEALFASDTYRPDQQTFMLYPDRELPRFLEKNRIPSAKIIAIPVLNAMLNANDRRIVARDADGYYRFHADLNNATELDRRIDQLLDEYGEPLESARPDLHHLYEDIFKHWAFTGRSGTMFGFEGLGSVFWHMVAKLLLATQENYFAALEAGSDPSLVHRLGELYYRVRAGLGFNKTPREYGAFPTDPHSHTPKHAGAQQPGMTGQVKEEIIARFGELGIRVSDGRINFRPELLRRCEFSTATQLFRYLDVDDNWCEIMLPANALGFSWCQLPVIYLLGDGDNPSLTALMDDGEQLQFTELSLPQSESSELFSRSGRIRRLTLELNRRILFD